MKKLTILSGPSCAGKTVLSKRLAELGMYKRLEFDKFFMGGDSSAGGRAKHLRSFIIPEIKEYLGEHDNILLDGYGYTWDEGAKDLKAFLGQDVQIEEWLMVIPAWAGVLRYKNRNKQDTKYGKADVINYYKWADGKKRWDYGTWKFIDGMEYGLKILPIHDKKDLLEYVEPRELNEKDEKRFFEDLQTLKYDKLYQAIDLPHEKFVGASESEKSWQRIQRLEISFDGMVVLELGCFHGYFSFKMLEAGAKAVIAIDATREALETARQIRQFKKLPVYFVDGNVTDVPFCRRNITVMMNMFHYVKNQPALLEKIFKDTEQVLLEINQAEEHMIEIQARTSGYVMKGYSTSHRSGRIFKVYEKERA